MPEPLETNVAALLLKLAATGEPPPPAAVAHSSTLSAYEQQPTEAHEVADMLSFRTIESLQDYRLYQGEEDKFLTLFAFLFRNSDLHHLDHAGHAVLPLESWQQLIQLATVGLREQQRFFFYARRYELLLASASGLNVAVYFLNGQHHPAFAELAQAYRLHLL
jgi:hypothetical protein